MDASSIIMSLSPSGLTLKFLLQLSVETVHSRGHHQGRHAVNSVHVLHPFQHLQGSKQVTDGIFAELSLWRALEEIESGRARANQFRFFKHDMYWSKGELQREFDAGVWMAASGSKNTMLDIVLRQCSELSGLTKPLWRFLLEVCVPSSTTL